jgi:FkbM family methyltransferase
MYTIEDDMKICEALRVKGEWESGVADAIEKYANPDWTFLDLGAHCGFFSTLAAPLFKQVIAVEPNPVAYSAFRKTIEYNEVGNIELHPVAVWSHAGEMPFVPVLRNSGSSWISRKDRPDLYSVDVPTVPLRKILGRRAPEFWKVDIEGAEYAALKGHERYIEQAKVIILEYSESQLQRTSNATGKKLYDLLSDFQWHKLDGTPIDYGDLTPNGYDNYLLRRV